MLAAVDSGREGANRAELVLPFERGDPLVGAHVTDHRRVVDDRAVLPVLLRVIERALGESGEFGAVDRVAREGRDTGRSGHARRCQHRSANAVDTRSGECSRTLPVSAARTGPSPAAPQRAHAPP